ncbi:MAG: PrpF protein [Betaproteobacteria bacterium RIFCSPLOWO2_12_FULL_66_14]|nr:MAG: PrpF protein [Betaproteobacteria bacterium RIFCSPLOWO2_12_FULL_66_14]
MQIPIPCLFMRGGTSRGPYFLASDLPQDLELRDRVLLSVMGSPDARQIDGLGGADPLTSKAAIVSPSRRPGVDLEFLFAQVLIDEARVDTTPNCGNMLAGVGPFALERGLVPASHAETTLRILTLNTDMLCDVVLQTPGGRITYEGNARIDGVPGTSAPIKINFLDTAGSVCGTLLPTGKVADVFDGVQVTCIDNGMPVVLMRAADLARSGYETRDELNADAELKARIEAIRLQAGPAMNLGDVRRKVVPKMCLIAAPKDGGTVCTRTFIPHDCHSAVGVLGAVTVASACVLKGSVAAGVCRLPEGRTKLISVEHPTGEFSVELELDANDPQTVQRSALLRTARPIMCGEVLIPSSVWDGRSSVKIAA